MLCLVDTNILLRFADRSHSLYPVILVIIYSLLNQLVIELTQMVAIFHFIMER